MTKTKKNSISKELAMFAFMLFVVSYIIVDVYNYHGQVSLNEAFLELHTLESEITDAQNTLHQGMQKQIDVIVKIIYQMAADNID